MYCLLVYTVFNQIVTLDLRTTSKCFMILEKIFKIIDQFWSELAHIPRDRNAEK